MLSGFLLRWDVGFALRFIDVRILQILGLLVDRHVSIDIARADSQTARLALAPPVKWGHINVLAAPDAWVWIKILYEHTVTTVAKLQNQPI